MRALPSTWDHRSTLGHNGIFFSNRKNDNRYIKQTQLIVKFMALGGNVPTHFATHPVRIR